MSHVRILRDCHHLASTNSRDKVYAVLGIARDRNEVGIISNYSAPLAQVCIDTALLILNQSHRSTSSAAFPPPSHPCSPPGFQNGLLVEHLHSVIPHLPHRAGPLPRMCQHDIFT
ncbi:hypothetical protein K432DRAFT_383457 [Lepidopterella palustris CBS 459.81]|uniref:Uncharacterized protein n=1 Tax=Lepidopterella palustris CBS 459.81 TaxID=1314670 RepID=A0A8E2JDY3_9PEZI|nr:hypothetical protein K432DRAFT_383457 [Lepidopterella palustris CBS 459.81]